VLILAAFLLMNRLLEEKGTYSQFHDHVILLPIFIFMAGMMFSARTFGKWGVLCCTYCVLRLFICFWSALTVGFGLLDPSGIGWIYRLVDYAANALLFVFLVFLIREVRNETRAPLVCGRG
jgi:hypothetical protein